MFYLFYNKLINYYFNNLQINLYSFKQSISLIHMYDRLQLNIILVLASLLLIGSAFQIPLPQTKTFDIEIDHIYSQTIPSFYQLYQSSELKNLTRLDSPQILVQQLICTIEDQQDNQYIQQSQYFHSNLADPQQFYLGRKKVASFDDLMKLTGIIDTITIDDKIIVLFQNGFYTIYQINPKDGKIKTEFVRHLQSDAQNIKESQFGTKIYSRLVGFGDLLYDKQNPEYIVFFGQQQALLMNKTSKRFQPLKGYAPIGQSYQKATLSKNNIYVATGFQGVFVYEVNYEMLEISLKQSFRPFYKDGEEMVYLMVSEIVYNSKDRNLIMVDPSEGIYWTELPSVEESQIECQPKPVLIQNCQNLNLVTQSHIPLLVATCPQLLIITLDEKRQHLNDEITFYPQSVIVNHSRILLFGEYRYAVYDIETALIQQGQSPRKIDFVQISQQHIIIVNTFAIYSGRVLPDQERIVCAVNAENAEKLIGTYQAILQIQGNSLSYKGICSQLYSPQFIEKTNINNPLLPSPQNLQKLQSWSNITQNCFLKYNVQFQIKDSSQVSYLGEIIMGVIILWILIGGLIAYCVKDIKINKEYNTLLEESVSSASDNNKSDASKIQQDTKEHIVLK